MFPRETASCLYGLFLTSGIVFSIVTVNGPRYRPLLTAHSSLIIQRCWIIHMPLATGEEDSVRWHWADCHFVQWRMLWVENCCSASGVVGMPGMSGVFPSGTNKERNLMLLLAPLARQESLLLLLIIRGEGFVQFTSSTVHLKCFKCKLISWSTRIISCLYSYKEKSVNSKTAIF